MDRKSYENVLSDFEQDIKHKQTEMEKLQEEIEQIESTIFILQTKLQSEAKNDSQIDDDESNDFFDSLTDKKYTKENQSKISLNDASEKVLLKEGKSLYIVELIKKIEEFGRFTNRVQLSGTIRKDHKDRFKNLGGNVWDLRSRHSQPLSKPSAVGSTFKHRPDTSDFVLVDAARETVKEFSGDEFSVSDIFEKLQTKYPNEINESRRRSVGSTVNNLMLKGELEKVRKGTFEKSALYRAK